MNLRNKAKFVKALSLMACLNVLAIGTASVWCDVYSDLEWSYQFLDEHPEYDTRPINEANGYHETSWGDQYYSSETHSLTFDPANLDENGEIKGQQSQSVEVEQTEPSTHASTPIEEKTAATNSTTKTEEAEEIEEETVVEITVDESVKGTYIATNNASIIKDYETEDAAGNLDVAKEYEVTGITSNGYYVVKYKNIEGYVSASDILLIEKEQYDAAWKEAVVNEPSCTEDGSVTYFNTYTEETNIVVDKPALGHQGDWQTVFAPSLFKDGKSENICSVCGELLDERVDNAPLSIFHILLFCILIAFIIVFSVKINNKRNVNKAKLSTE